MSIPYTLSTLLSYFKNPPTASNSFFISFEGIEASGKSTQVPLFANQLKEAGYHVHILREPGGTSFGESLREAILNSKVPLCPIAEAQLFAAARAQLLMEKTLPLLQNPNSVVIHDRFIDSSLCYQGVARGLGIETVLALHQFYPLHFLPHITFYLKISLETSKQRQLKRGQTPDYFEGEKEQFHRLLIEGFEKLIPLFPKRIAVIDAENDAQDVTRSLWNVWNAWNALEKKI